MGEFSDYFEDFPEENPANSIDGRFDPQAALANRALSARIAKESQDYRDKINAVIERAKESATPDSDGTGESTSPDDRHPPNG